MGVIFEFIVALKAKPSTSRVSAGAMTPSSQHRAEEKYLLDINGKRMLDIGKIDGEEGIGLTIKDTDHLQLHTYL